MKIVASVIFLDRPVESLEWVLYILILSMALIVVGRILFNNIFEELFRFEKFQEINDNQGLFGIMLQVVFALLISSLSLGYLLSDYDYIFHTPIIKVLAVTVVLLLFFSLRTLLGRVGAFALGVAYDASYNLKTFNIFRAYAVGVLWMGTLLFYFSNMHKPTLLIILAGLLLFIRVQTYIYLYKTQTDKQTRFWYYIILYLCTLEILPIMVVFKFLNIW